MGQAIRGVHGGWIIAERPFPITSWVPARRPPAGSAGDGRARNIGTADPEARSASLRSALPAPGFTIQPFQGQVRRTVRGRGESDERGFPAGPLDGLGAFTGKSLIVHPIRDIAELLQIPHMSAFEVLVKLDGGMAQARASCP